MNFLDNTFLDSTHLLIGIIGVFATQIWKLLKFVFNKGKITATDEKQQSSIKIDVANLQKDYKELDLLIKREIEQIRLDKSLFDKDWLDWKYKRESTDKEQDKELSYLRKSYDNVLERIEKIQIKHDENLDKIYNKINEINQNLTVLQTLEKERKNGK